jgi:PPE-repeat protein
MWERNGQHEEVALYVRALVTAEQPTATAAERTLVVRLLDSLGISSNGLARNRWIIGDSPIRQARAAADTGPSVKDRFRPRVIEGGAS